ncbi:MAG: hypothetical protein AAF458_17590 [Pseudomonadota bacterium]
MPAIAQESMLYADHPSFTNEDSDMDAKRLVSTLSAPARARLLAGTAAAVLSTTFGQAQATVTFQDTEFNTVGNEWFTVNTQNAGGNSSSVGSLGAGGNPGSLLQGTVNLTPPHPTSVNASAFAPQFVFDPSAEGAINAFDFSMDATGFRGNFAFGIALRQNGNIFQRQLNNILQIDPFITQAQIGLTAADFAAVDNAGTLDFSDSGSAIDFGFFYRTSTAPAGNQSFQFSARFDNFSVVIDNAAVEASEPVSLGLAAGGLALAGMVRRRRPAA